ncbi:MAG: sulfatase-like hydrolase/transferase [Bacilli bacterium]
MDSLASQGIKFNRHYAGSTVCAPSRSCLLTGSHRTRSDKGQYPIKLDTGRPARNASRHYNSCEHAAFMRL